MPRWLARLFRRPPKVPPPDDTYVMGRGQSDPEYATVILRLCGVKEEWTQVDGEWVSSVATTRGALEMLVRTVKERTVKNVLAHERMKGSRERVERFLNQPGERT
jgi:hypothetical protein